MVLGGGFKSGRVLGTQIIVEIQFSTQCLQALFGLLKWEEGGAWESLKDYRPDPGTQLESATTLEISYLITQGDLNRIGVLKTAVLHSLSPSSYE